MSLIREQQQLLHFGPGSASEHQWYEDKDRLSAEDLGRPEGAGQGPGYGHAETWGEAVFENSGFIFWIWSELDLYHEHSGKSEMNVSNKRLHLFAIEWASFINQLAHY